MALETVRCYMCYGTGKLPKDKQVEAHSERKCTCSRCGNEHIEKAYKVGDPCHTCGGSGNLIETNFGRQ